MSINSVLGEIRIFSSQIMPEGWLPCNGQILQVQQYPVLWTILGATYGGDGQTTFALPDLRSRVPVSQKAISDVGKKGGEETHALKANEMAAHTHQVHGFSARANSSSPTGHLWADESGKTPFSTQVDSAGVMSSDSVSFEGAGESHDNMSPFMAVNFGICVSGGFPHDRQGTIGEVIMYAGFKNSERLLRWLPCDGRVLPIIGSPLFNLIGFVFGGNGLKTFALPDFREAAPIHYGQGKELTNREFCDRGGAAAVALTKEQLPKHTHLAKARSVAATTSDPTYNMWAIGGGETRGGVPLYINHGDLADMNPSALSAAGGGAAHNNMPPFIYISFLICTEGEFPHNPDTLTT